MRRVYRETDDPVAAVLQVEFQGFRFFLPVFVFFLAGVLVFLLFPVLFLFFQQCQFFFAHAEPFVGIEVEEHDVDVTFSAPASVAPVSGSVAFPDHGLPVEHPFRVRVGVAAFGQVVDFSVA